MDKIDRFVKELKENDESVTGVIVTDDSGLKIYPPKQSEALETLGGALATMINTIKSNLKEIGVDNLKLLSLRVENYIIIIVPNVATITIIVKRKR